MTTVKLFFIFCYFGCLSFGGGQSLVPIYIDHLVETWRWLSLEEFGNLMAISQMTPGPIGINAATFLGFRQAGFTGALAATAGLLFPSYFLVLLALKSLDKWERSRVVQGVMSGIRPATVGLIAASLFIFLQMSVFSEGIPWAAIGGFFTGAATAEHNFFLRPGALLIFAAATALLCKTRLSIMSVIFAGAILGAFICR